MKRCRIDGCLTYVHLTRVILAADQARRPDDRASCEALAQAMKARDWHIEHCDSLPPRAVP